MTGWKRTTVAFALTLLAAQGAAQAGLPEPRRDADGRPIIEGPVASGVYHRVRIVSPTVGVHAVLPTTITDSVIEAPVCVSSSGRGLTLRGNLLDCNLCIEFTEGLLIDIVIADNTCKGFGTSRPDILGW